MKDILNHYEKLLLQAKEEHETLEAISDCVFQSYKSMSRASELINKATKFASALDLSEEIEVSKSGVEFVIKKDEKGHPRIIITL